MRIKPMLGSFELAGIESIDSSERRALVEHRVPGLAGSYFQDLGSAPNTIVITGTRHGDDARDEFLEGIRSIFNAGEETTFAADINTATDITDVVIEDLDVAEIAGAPDSFRYVLRLRKYVPPPEPPAAGLPGLDSDLLDQAGQLVGALDTLDALSSIPDLGDPTPPLRGALGEVETATAGVEPAVTDLETRLGEDPAGPTGELPRGEELSGSLGGIQGDATAGTGVAGALASLENADVGGRTSSLVSQLDGSLTTALPAEDAAPGAAAVGQLTEAAGTLPQDPATLTAPVAEPLEQIRRLVSPEVAGGILSGLRGLEGLQTRAAGGSEGLTSGASEQIVALTHALGSGRLDALRQWSGAVSSLETELTALVESAAGDVVDRLIAFLAERASGLRDSIVAGGTGPASRLVTAMDAAVDARPASIRQAATDLTAALGRAQAEVAAGHLASTAEIAAAEQIFQRLVDESSALASGIQRALSEPAASAAGLAEELARLHASFREIDVIDLAQPRELFDDALAELRTAIAAVDLGSAREAVEGVLGEITAAVEQLDLGRLTQILDEAEGAIREALAVLDGAVVEVLALVRSAFAAVRDALGTVTAALGTFDTEGNFHFALEGEIETLLNQVQSVVRDTIEPAIAEFREAVGTAIGEVTSVLEQARGEIESVKAQLTGAIQGAVDQLRAADIGGAMDSVRQTLESAVAELGPIDFDPVVDPVVAQIDDMRDQLRSIDPSSLNDILRAALEVAVAVVTAIDFPNEITNVLMEEFDKLLALPGEGLDRLQERIDAMVERFEELEPSSIVEPLSGLFEPLMIALDGLDLEPLAAPIEEWYQQARQELDKVLPEQLLAPLVQAHRDLTTTFASISTDSLVEELRGTVAQIQGELERLEPAALVGELTSAVDQARAFLDSLAPGRVFEPLISAFDTVTRAIDELSPTPFLAPLTRLSELLRAPLEGLTDEDAARAAEVFAPIAGLAAAFDPRAGFETAAAKVAEVEAVLGALNLGALLAEVRASHGALGAAVAAAGDAAAPLAARVQALNPLANPAMAQATADLQQARTRLRDALPFGDPPPALAASYEEIREDVEGLMPAWSRQPSAAAIREALAWADPGAIAAGVQSVHEDVKAQWLALDPRALANELEELHTTVVGSLDAVDPAAIAGRIEGLVQDLGPTIGRLDLEPIASEARDIEDDVRTVIDALDPQPVIDRLSSLANDVKRVVDQLDPAALLAELEEPLEGARAILREFDPASFAEALEPAFAEIEAILERVDLRVILEPLLDLLQNLRDALEAALERTEEAFRGMIAAIPR